jgi:hypothetical protein
MKSFRERAFLVKALIGIFVIQFVYVGVQAAACRQAIVNQTIPQRSQVDDLCKDASRNFLEVGKLAIPTILALLVKGAPEDSDIKSGVNLKTKKEGEEEEETLPSDNKDKFVF